ncbi:hypothetical protein DPMN_150666, partial [Dreissena polymorpha]
SYAVIADKVVTQHDVRVGNMDSIVHKAVGTGQYQKINDFLRKWRRVFNVTVRLLVAIICGTGIVFVPMLGVILVQQVFTVNLVDFRFDSDSWYILLGYKPGGSVEIDSREKTGDDFDV